MAGLIEHRTIEAIPEDQRHGRTRDLFTIWYSTNLGPLTTVTGALAVTSYGLSFWWSLAAILVGNLAAGLLMALHSAQGPQLGVPQMIQSRGQFGSLGSILVVVITIIMYIGFYSAGMQLGGQSFHTVAPAVSTNMGVVICSIGGLIITVVGYRLMHLLGRWTTYILGGITLLALVYLPVHGLPADFFHKGGFTAAGFLSMVGVGAVWQIAYAPYVSDYSRYMPKTVAHVRSTLWNTYWGCTLGSIVPMLLGVVLGLSIDGTDVIAGLNKPLGHGLGTATLWCFALAILLTNAMNLYGGMLCTLTIAKTLRASWNPTPFARNLTILVLGAGSSVLAIGFGGKDFMTNYTNFIYLLQYLLVPWTAINLIDFYLIRHGDYHVPSFFAAGGGIYGRFSARPLIVYAIGVLIEVPFMVNDLYTGPIAHALHGVDLSWIVGLVVTAPLYWTLARRAPAPVMPMDPLPQTA